MKNASLTIITALILTSACQQTSPVDGERAVTADASASVPCLETPQSAQTLPMKPVPCTYPKTLVIGGEERAVDFAELRATLEGIATKAVLESRGPRCVDGCEFAYYATFVPKLKSFLANGRKYEKARDCQQYNEVVGCSSGPDDWTFRGWSYFMRDLLNEWSAQNAPVFDGEEVSAKRVADYLAE